MKKGIFMRSTIHYKPSGKYSAAGLIALFISVTVVGIILSWIYLLLNSVITLVYLCVLIAFLVSAAIGFTGGYLVKKFKIRNPAMAMLALCLGLVIANYTKWAIYVSRDFDDLYYDDMKSTTAYQYYLGSEAEYDVYFEDVDDFIDTFKNTPASLFINDMTADEMKYMSDEDIESLQNDSMWDYFDFDNILGTDAETVEKSLEKAAEMNAYEFTFDYREMKPKTTGYLMTHPGEMFKDIKNINDVGRWSYRANTTSSYSTTVNGFMLWLVWLGELLILTLPAAFAVHKNSTFPFIESEDDWAEKVESDNMFKFSDRDSMGIQVTSVMMKQKLSATPDYILDMRPASSGSDSFYSVSYCHSRSFEENYISVKLTTITYKGKKAQTNTKLITQFILVDADYIATLYGIFGLPVPAMCKGRNTRVQTDPQPAKAKAPTSAAVNAEDIFNQPVPDIKSPQTVKASAAVDTENANDDFAAAQLREEQKSSVIDKMNGYDSNSPTSGEMDGLDTSNLNLDDIYK